MEDKKIIKICKKLIRYRHDDPTFYKFDKYLKITRVKIVNISIIKQIKSNNVYKVNYKFGLNLWNPLSWIVIILLFLIYVGNAIKEFTEEFNSNSDEYSELYKIKY